MLLLWGVWFIISLHALQAWYHSSLQSMGSCGRAAGLGLHELSQVDSEIEGVVLVLLRTVLLARLNTSTLTPLLLQVMLPTGWNQSESAIGYSINSSALTQDNVYNWLFRSLNELWQWREERSLIWLEKGTCFKQLEYFPNNSRTGVDSYLLCEKSQLFDCCKTTLEQPTALQTRLESGDCGDSSTTKTHELLNVHQLIQYCATALYGLQLWWGECTCSSTASTLVKKPKTYRNPTCDWFKSYEAVNTFHWKKTLYIFTL